MTFKLILGLGNPTEKYENTYHNVGLLALAELAKIAGQEKPVWEHVPSKKFVYAKINGLTLAKPLTFMNVSGEATQSALKYFNSKPEDLLVIHDDSDIYLGDYKLSFDRGAGGHHGIENIEEIIKTKKFWRLRIGIRPPEKTNAVSPEEQTAKKPRAKAETFVLKKISKTNKEILAKIFAEALPKIINGGILP